jgi:hypothetical protein
MLFWEIDVETLDLAAHRDYVMERVMTRGTLAAMRWLVQTYSREEIGDFVRRRGDRLTPRDRAFWSLIGGASIDPGPGGGRPAWAG